jgi:hypothetical protein
MTKGAEPRLPLYGSFLAESERTTFDQRENTMKFKVIVSLISLFVCHTALSQQTNNVVSARNSDYPVTGMSAMDLANCFSELKYKLPVGPKIIAVRLFNERKITITTGSIENKYQGIGVETTYELKDGKWVATNKATWVY